MAAGELIRANPIDGVVLLGGCDKTVPSLSMGAASVDMPDEDLAARELLPQTTAAFARPARGYERLYVDHVTQAGTGADFDFLVGSSGSAVGRESH